MAWYWIVLLIIAYFPIGYLVLKLTISIDGEDWDDLEKPLGIICWPILLLFDVFVMGLYFFVMGLYFISRFLKGIYRLIRRG